MKWILSLLAAGGLVMTGCQCQKKMEEPPAAVVEPDAGVPTEEQMRFENMDQEGGGAAVPEDGETEGTPGQ